MMIYPGVVTAIDRDTLCEKTNLRVPLLSANFRSANEIVFVASPVDRLASRIRTDITFRPSKDLTGKYALKVRQDFVDYPDGVNEQGKPAYMVYAETIPENKGDKPYPTAIATGIFMAQDDVVHLGWVIVLDYPAIFREIKTLQQMGREHGVDKSLFYAMKFCILNATSPQAMDLSPQMRFLYFHLKSMLPDGVDEDSIVSDEIVVKFFEEAPKDLRRLGIGNALTEFISSFIPLGGKISFSLSNYDSLAHISRGGIFEDSLIGNWFQNLGYRAIRRNEGSPWSLPTYVLEKKEQVTPKTRFLTNTPKKPDLADQIKVNEDSFPPGDRISDFAQAYFLRSVIKEAVVMGLLQKTVDTAYGRTVEISGLGELRYIFSGRDSELRGKRRGSQTILSLEVEIKDIGTRNFIFVVDNHVMSHGAYTREEYDNLKRLNDLVPKLFVKVYQTENIAVRGDKNNLLQIYTAEVLGDQYRPFYLVGQRPLGIGSAFLYARDLKSAYTERYKGEITPEAAGGILVSLVARLTELQVKHGLIVKDMNFYEGDVMIDPALPANHDEYIKITAARKLEGGTLYDLLTYLLFLRQDTRSFNGDKTEENAQVFFPRVVLEAIYKGLVNIEGEEKAKSLMGSLLGRYLSERREYEEDIKGFCEKQSIVFERESIGYERILKVVNVGGQELTVIDEEKVNTDLIEPEEVIMPGEEQRLEATRLADKELESGAVGLITVGGGMSSRAGINYPKGETPIALLSKKTLYQCMAEELLAARIHYGKVVPWYIMTSDAMGNDEATRKYFEENDYFNLGRENVIFVKQENVGALESGTREAAMSDENKSLTVPNGHGGIYKAMRDPNARTDGGQISALNDARARGVHTFLYTHVDNALPVVNRTLLGLHLGKGADYTTTLVKKRNPAEGLAMVARDKKTGRKFFVEYNQPAAAIIKDREGFEYGSINRNVFSIDFFSAAEDPPFHMAIGKKSRIYKDGSIQDGKIDKFERFIFDNFGLAKNAICVGLPREECFATFKEMTGPDSPEVVSKMLSNYDKLLIAKAMPGIVIPETAVVELPRIAHFLTPEDLAKNLKALNFEAHLKENAKIVISDGFKAIYDVDIVEFEIASFNDTGRSGVVPGYDPGYCGGLLIKKLGKEKYDELNEEFSAGGMTIAKIMFELVGNTYRHSDGGKVKFSYIFKDGKIEGISVISESRGIGIKFDDFIASRQDLGDYYDGVGSPRTGFIEMMNYADEFSIDNIEGGGNIVRITKWKSADARSDNKKIEINIKISPENSNERYREWVISETKTGSIHDNLRKLLILSLDKGPVGKLARKILEEYGLLPPDINLRITNAMQSI